jgi:hypothetical protein
MVVLGINQYSNIPSFQLPKHLDAQGPTLSDAGSVGNPDNSFKLRQQIRALMLTTGEPDENPKCQNTQDLIGRSDSSTVSELKAVEEACREAYRTVEGCAPRKSLELMPIQAPVFSLRGSLRRHSTTRRTQVRAVTKVRVPLTAPLWSEIQDMPNGTQQIDTALFDVARERRMN